MRQETDEKMTTEQRDMKRMITTDTERNRKAKPGLVTNNMVTTMVTNE